MHWARVIRETDNPEWTAILHADGSVSEVKVSVDHDVVHIHVDKPGGVRCIVTDHESPA
jgi:hypothetical protein